MISSTLYFLIFKLIDLSALITNDWYIYEGDLYKYIEYLELSPFYFWTVWQLYLLNFPDHPINGRTGSYYKLMTLKEVSPIVNFWENLKTFYVHKHYLYSNNKKRWQTRFVRRKRYQYYLYTKLSSSKENKIFMH